MPDDKNNACEARPGLAISIVLYQSGIPALNRMLSSTREALENDEGQLSLFADLYLTDHSPDALPADCLKKLQCAAGEHICLNYEYVGSNPGFGAGHNRAFVKAKGADYFLIANPDIEFAAGSLMEGIAFLDDHPEIGLLAPALIELDGGQRPACFRYPDVMTLLSRLVGGTWAKKCSFSYECRDWDSGQIRIDPPLVSGCCMLFRADIYTRLGGFDPGFFLYFEDFDISLRANRITHSAYCPNMKVTHAGGGVGRKGLKHIVLFMQSAARFFAKHGFRFRG